MEKEGRDLDLTLKLKQRSNLIKLIDSRETERVREREWLERDKEGERERVSYHFYYIELVSFVVVKKVFNSISVEADRCDIVSGSYCEEKKRERKSFKFII